MDPNELKLIPLSPREWQVLVCVYDLGSADPFQVADLLQARKLVEWYAPKTAAGVLLARLASKGYLEVSRSLQPRGRPLHIYRPIVSREAALKLQFEKFLKDYCLSDKDQDALVSFLEAYAPTTP